MNKKPSVSLAPLLAIAAFAAMPAAAQAAPHIFINNTKVAEGQQVPLTLSGTIKLANATFGTVECRTSATAFLENPVGRGSAIGKLQSITFSPCADSVCTTAVGHVEVTGSNLPWKLAVTERKGVFRMVIGEASTNPESIVITVNCEGVPVSILSGQLSPMVLQPPPDRLVFDEELESGTSGTRFGGLLVFGGEGSAIEIKKK